MIFCNPNYSLYGRQSPVIFIIMFTLIYIIKKLCQQILYTIRNGTGKITKGQGKKTRDSLWIQQGHSLPETTHIPFKIYGEPSKYFINKQPDPAQVSLVSKGGTRRRSRHKTNTIRIRISSDVHSHRGTGRTRHNRKSNKPTYRFLSHSKAITNTKIQFTLSSTYSIPPIKNIFLRSERNR